MRAYVRECHTCQKNKYKNVLTPSLLQPLPIPRAPFVDISMDFIEGLLNSKEKNVVLVVVDRFSKYAHFIALYICHSSRCFHEQQLQTTRLTCLYSQ